MAKKTQDRKNKRPVRDKADLKKANRVKAIIFLCVAVFFFAYMIYAGGSIGSFFSLIIGLVCGLLGILYLRENRKTGRKPSGKGQKR